MDILCQIILSNIYIVIYRSNTLATWRVAGKWRSLFWAMRKSAKPCSYKSYSNLNQVRWKIHPWLLTTTHTNARYSAWVNFISSSFSKSRDLVIFYLWRKSIRQQVCVKSIAVIEKQRTSDHGFWHIKQPILQRCRTILA